MSKIYSLINLICRVFCVKFSSINSKRSKSENKFLRTRAILLTLWLLLKILSHAYDEQRHVPYYQYQTGRPAAVFRLSPKSIGVASNTKIIICWRSVKHYIKIK